MKLKNTTTIFLFLMITFMIFPNFVKGQITQTIYPIKDAFAGTLYPDDNTGPDPWLWVSSAEYAEFGRCQAYIEFELPSDYNSYSVINLHFHIVLGDHDSRFKILIYRVIQEWDELTLTWNNRPSLWDYILSWELESDRTYDINVKDDIVTPIFSICILAEEFQFNLGQIPSKDNDYFTGDRCLAIILTNMVTIIISSIVGLMAVSGAIVAIIFYKKKKKARNNIPIDSKKSEVEN